ncbi:MAG: FtsX-like permease family protein [Nocardioidaceae bacterium]
MTVGAAAVATVVMLGLLAVDHSEQVLHPSLYDDPDMRRLLLATVLAVTLPVLVLLSVAAKLSAQLRERRLANLRLLGLPPSRTRIVAVTEVAASALAGALIGILVFWLVRPFAPHVDVAGRSWSTASLTPTLRGYVAVLAAVPIAVSVVAGLPRRADRAGALAVAHASAYKRPSWWRVAPLVAGVALCLYVMREADKSANTANVIPYFIAAVASLGVGVVLLLPLVVRFVADLLLRLSQRPVFAIAARQLQAQPAGVNRVISGLLIGLFLVTGARGVVAAFEGTPQYRDAAAQLRDQQVATVQSTSGQVRGLIARIKTIPEVTNSTAFPVLQGACQPTSSCPWAIVASCAQLRAAALGSAGCTDDHPMWIGEARRNYDPDAQQQRRWQPVESRRKAATSLVLPSPQGELTRGDLLHRLLSVDVVIPASLAGVRTLLPMTMTEVYVTAAPGRDLSDKLLRLRGVEVGARADFVDYDFVAKLRALVWSITTVIVSLGLLAFAIGAIDRAINRRREVVSLQLAGVSKRVLRKTQLVEAAVPIVFGCVLAIGCGVLASASYLSIGGQSGAVPWQAAGGMAAMAVAGSIAVAALTVIASSPRIRPDLIRSE